MKKNNNVNTVLTIAGSDCSGGAGIQADIKTISAYGLYAMSAITALTAQNTTGVYGVEETDPEFLRKQLDCVFSDIFPDAVKIGMLCNKDIIEVISDTLEKYRPRNIVLDPVMISTSGRRLLSEDAQDFLMEQLIPQASLVTPNIPEAESMTGISIKDSDDMIMAAQHICHMTGCPAVLVKGGHREDAAEDILYSSGHIYGYKSELIDNPNTHGTGCTLSSAIASGLAKGMCMDEAVSKAKRYITGAISAGLNIGQGNGPLDHMYQLKENKH